MTMVLSSIAPNPCLRFFEKRFKLYIRPTFSTVPTPSVKLGRYPARILTAVDAGAATKTQPSHTGDRTPDVFFEYAGKYVAVLFVRKLVGRRERGARIPRVVVVTSLDEQHRLGRVFTQTSREYASCIAATDHYEVILDVQVFQGYEWTSSSSERPHLDFVSSSLDADAR